MKNIVCVLVSLLLLLSQSRADAAPLGGTVQVTNTNVTSMFVTYLSQAPGETWTFTTTNLSSGADTVINVQDANSSDGNFVAGNDDSVGLASHVVVAPVANARVLAVIVRAFNLGSGGTCVLLQSSSVSGDSTVSLNLGGAAAASVFNNLAAGAHVTTVERAGGSKDTVLLLYSPGAPAHAVGFDDDDGVANMSSIHVPEPCGGCVMAVANFNTAAADVNATVVWDQEVDTSDADADGLGPTLEAAIGTSAVSADTDQDGVPDGAELLGLDTSPAQKFPLMGANPVEKDLFVEVDWQQCTDVSCGGIIDLNQIGSAADPSQIIAYTDAVFAQIQHDMAPLHVHLDIGRLNTNPNTWYNWGDWGGATAGDWEPPRGPTEPDPLPFDIAGNRLYGCEGATPARHSLFHFAVSVPQGGHVNGNFMPGSCMVIQNASGHTFDTLTAGRVFAHELGHTFGLTHGGRPGRASINLKSNYFSIMNYFHQWTAPSFSHGNATDLKPTALDETFGLGLIGAQALTALQNAWCPGGRCVDVVFHSVDWDRDGIISSGNNPVQGAVAVSDRCDQAHSEFVNQLVDPVLSWVPGASAPTDWLFMVGRSMPGQVLQYSRVNRTKLDAGCSSFAPTDMQEYARNTNCAGFANAVMTVPGNKVLAQGPGVADVIGGLLVVWQGTTGTLTSNLATVNNSTGAAAFAANVTLPGRVTALGDVTALATAAGVVTVWARGGNPVRLKQWKFQNGTWTGPVDQLWSDGTPISPLYGIGATMGFQDGSSTANVYAAIPTAPIGTVEFARQAASGAQAGRWSKLSSWSDVASAQPVATGRPGLAYQRRAGQANTVGRFYMAWSKGLKGATTCTGLIGDAATNPCAAELAMTEGNLTTGTTRRLQWLKPTYFGETGMPGGITLLDDLTRDKNLRAAVNHSPDDKTELAWFLPVADGIYNTTIGDVDDYAYITGALRASLSLDGGTWPGGVLPATLH